MENQKFYDIVNDETDGLLQRIRNLDYIISDEEKAIVIDVAKQLR